MRILISTGIFPPEIGGPAQYAKNLCDELRRQGFGVEVATFGIEKKLPTGVRHAVFFFKALWSVAHADRVLLLDTLSVALPTVVAAKIFRRPVVVRIGGDFLWESYVERTHEPVPLTMFYVDRKYRDTFTYKERLIFACTKYVLRNVDAIAFTSAWQLAIWKDAYGLGKRKETVIGNFIGGKLPSFPSERKVFLWAGRPIFLKNIDMLKRAFEEAKREWGEIELECIQVSQDELHAKIAYCYAVIVPSLTEVSSNLVLDAIRYGKPFIVTKHTGHMDLLKDCGLFVDPLSVSDIAEKILWLSDPGNYEEQRMKVERFTAAHSWREIADEFLKLFETL